MTSDDFFEEIRKHLMDELPLVVYRKPNETQLKSLLQTDTELYEIIDFTEKGFIFAPFDDKERAILLPYGSSKYLTNEIAISRDSNISTGSLPKQSQSSENQKLFHIKLVQKAIDKIKEHALLKVVISRNETIHLSSSNPIEIFKTLLTTYPSTFVYCWYHPKVGLWLGATPETLLKVEGNRLSTMSLAGTQKFVDTENVIWPDKERHEQQLVTDFIVKSLESSVSNLHISDVETMRTGNLLHLKTTLTAKLKSQNSNLKELIQNLHPTPAVCGLPKAYAKQFIMENEAYNREFYTGFLGELNFKEKTTRNSNRHNVENDAYATIKTVSNIYVNLRCMQLKDNQAIVYVGGGITKDSIPENEWEETVSKSEVIKSVL